MPTFGGLVGLCPVWGEPAGSHRLPGWAGGARLGAVGAGDELVCFGVEEAAKDPRVGAGEPMAGIAPGPAGAASPVCAPASIGPG